MRTFEEIISDINAAVSSNDVDALLAMAQEVKELVSPKAEAARLNALGSVYHKAGDQAAALEHFHRGMDILEELGDRANIAKINRNLGLICYDTGDFPKALEYYRRALAMHQDLGDRANMALVMDNIGNAYFNTSDYPLALEYMSKALDIHEELGDGYSVARVTGNMGNIYSANDDHSQALAHYGRSLSLYQELGRDADASMVTGNIGLVYQSKREYPMALDFYQRALKLFQEQGDHSGAARITGNMISLLLNTGRYDEAAIMLDQQASMKMEDPGIRASHFSNRAGLAMANNDLETAWGYQLQGLEIATTAHVRMVAASCHLRLRDLAQKRNDFAGYIEHNNEYNRITDEIRGKDATQKMAMMEAERKMEKERIEHQKHLAVLHSTLPKHIADRVARGETVNDHYDNASVIFLDIVGFTTLSDQLTSEQVVQLLEHLFSALDAVCEKHDVVKIKTIGDSYMAVAFPSESSNSEQRAASAAFDMLYAVAHILPDLPEGLRADLPEGVLVRIGIHSGPVTAGVIGTTRMQYDVWGDTVNTASRMESNGEAGRIHVSEELAKALNKARNKVHIVPRGEIEIKGKGMMTTYWLESA